MEADKGAVAPAQPKPKRKPKLNLSRAVSEPAFRYKEKYPHHKTLAYRTGGGYYTEIVDLHELDEEEHTLLGMRDDILRSHKIIKDNRVPGLVNVGRNPRFAPKFDRDGIAAAAR